ncbi:hypothetical protein BCR39DRAFT_551911 [Naematelia encephala]|uniref:Uncharacterized protein n=1 Tax=Naematelia encephala TaxID=71784 RepID=A0A1Y2AI17_9TREE|nr:hypothetical protein BCR39DRAFT_551911 [Naematelia encephala]
MPRQPFAAPPAALHKLGFELRRQEDGQVLWSHKDPALTCNECVFTHSVCEFLDIQIVTLQYGSGIRPGACIHCSDRKRRCSIANRARSQRFYVRRRTDDEPKEDGHDDNTSNGWEQGNDGSSRSNRSEGEAMDGRVTRPPLMSSGEMSRGERNRRRTVRREQAGSKDAVKATLIRQYRIGTPGQASPDNTTQWVFDAVQWTAPGRIHPDWINLFDWTCVKDALNDRIDAEVPRRGDGKLDNPDDFEMGRHDWDALGFVDEKESGDLANDFDLAFVPATALTESKQNSMAYLPSTSPSPISIRNQADEHILDMTIPPIPPVGKSSVQDARLRELRSRKAYLIRLVEARDLEIESLHGRLKQLTSRAITTSSAVSFHWIPLRFCPDFPFCAYKLDSMTRERWRTEWRAVYETDSDA